MTGILSAEATQTAGIGFPHLTQRAGSPVAAANKVQVGA